MATKGQQTIFFETDVYHRASSDLLTLKSALPPEAVATLAREVISRLSGRVADKSERSDVVNDLCATLLSDDPLAAANLIETLFESGVNYDALYLGYLAPAARQLGEMWTDDTLSFAGVTVGTGRIYGIMRSLSRRMPRSINFSGKAAMVACVPGETHTLGVSMATDLLRERGWNIDQHLSLDHDALINKVVESGHILIGLSAAGTHALPALARLVLAIRVIRPDAAIMISGNIVREARQELTLMGVDGMSETFAEASALLDNLWNEAATIAG